MSFWLCLSVFNQWFSYFCFRWSRTLVFISTSCIRDHVLYGDLHVWPQCLFHWIWSLRVPFVHLLHVRRYVIVLHIEPGYFNLACFDPGLLENLTVLCINFERTDIRRCSLVPCIHFPEWKLTITFAVQTSWCHVEKVQLRLEIRYFWLLLCWVLRENWKTRLRLSGGSTRANWLEIVIAWRTEEVIFSQVCVYWAVLLFTWVACSLLSALFVFWQLHWLSL